MLLRSLLVLLVASTALANTVEVGSYARKGLIADCELKDELESNGQTVNDLPEEFRVRAAAAIVRCTAIIDLGIDPQVPTIKAAIAQVASGDAPAARWQDSDIPGGCATIEQCAHTAATLCNIVQTTPMRMSASLGDGGICSMSCKTGERRKIWGRMICDEP